MVKVQIFLELRAPTKLDEPLSGLLRSWRVNKAVVKIQLSVSYLELKELLFRSKGVENIAFNKI